MEQIQPLANVSDSDWLLERSCLVAIPFLSLDFIGPHIRDLAIDTPDVRGFQQLLREAIQRNPLAFVLRNHRVTDSEVIRDLQAKSEQFFSSGSASSLTSWVKGIFMPLPSDLWYYESTLRQWWAAWTKRDEDFVGLAGITPVVEAYRSSLDIESIRTSLRQLKLGVAGDVDTSSEWDRFLYNLRLYLHDADLCDRINNLVDGVLFHEPFELLEECILRVKFYKFWRVMLREATSPVLGSLHLAAERRAKRSLPMPSEIKFPLAGASGNRGTGTA